MEYQFIRGYRSVTDPASQKSPDPDSHHRFKGLSTYRTAWRRGSCRRRSWNGSGYSCSSSCRRTIRSLHCTPNYVVTFVACWRAPTLYNIHTYIFTLHLDLDYSGIKFLLPGFCLFRKCRIRATFILFCVFFFCQNSQSYMK